MTSAFDTVTQRTGVCRDFSHLGIALCRALNIPARYFAGYAYELEPPDFHACFECFIGGSWMVFDATRLAHLNGLVRDRHRPRRGRRRGGQHLRQRDVREDGGVAARWARGRPSSRSIASTWPAAASPWPPA